MFISVHHICQVLPCSIAMTCIQLGTTCGVCVARPCKTWPSVPQACREQKQQNCHNVLHKTRRLGQRLQPVQATSSNNTQQQQDGRKQAPATAPPPNKQQLQPGPLPEQQQQGRLETVLSWMQQRWAPLTLPQRAYTVVAGLVLLAAVPKVVTLVVLMLERVLIGGLLLIEEVLLELLVKGGVLLGVVGVLALLGTGVYVFTQKTTK